MARRILPKFSFALNISGHKYICTSHLAPTCSRDTHINVHTEVTIIVHCCPLLPIVAHCCPLFPNVSEVKNCPRCQIVHSVKLSAVSNCPVSNCLRCQIVLVLNCPQCQIVCSVKLSVVSNCSVSNCPDVKLSSCQIIRQHGRCQIVRGVKLS